MENKLSDLEWDKIRKDKVANLDADIRKHRKCREQRENNGDKRHKGE